MMAGSTRSRLALTSDGAAEILRAAAAFAAARNWPVTVAVVDDGGHAMGLLRLEGAAPSSVDIALGKARTAALSRRESKFYEEMLAGRPGFLSAPGLPCLLEGGVPVIVAGECVGAVGVSGVKSSDDVAVARAGIAASAA